MSNESIRALEVAKLGVLGSKDAAFLGPLICSTEVKFSDKITEAATDGNVIFVNEDFFLNAPSKSRITILMHELWHIAKLHHIRRGERNPEGWNIACDQHINLSLKREGYSFEGIEVKLDKSFAGKSEEEIYSLIESKFKDKQQPEPNNQGGGGSGEGEGEDDPKKDPKNPNGDLLQQAEGEDIQQVSKVVQAIQQAEMSGYSGAEFDSIKSTMDKFLKPTVDWKVVLKKYLNDLKSHDYSWQKRNRRYRDIYLPSLVPNTDKLEHIAYYIDVSGSVSDKQVTQFNSEVKYIFDNLKPTKVSIIQFDTQIRNIVEYKEGQKFTEITVVGRGGTCFECVAKHIQEINPSAAIIFSDMECRPMEPFKSKTDLIWVGLGRYNFPKPFKGKVLRIEEL